MRAALLASLVAASGLAACGGGGGGGSPPPPPPPPPPATSYTVSTSIGPGTSISPTALQVQQGQSGQLTVSLLGGYQNLSVSGCGGTLSGSTYTVNPTANCTVTASATAIPAPSGYNVETFAGNGNPNLGDGGLATSATLVAPDRVLVSSSGVVYISDTNNNRIASVDAAGIIRTFAGRISAEHQNLGDGGLATDAVVRFPRGLYETANGIYIGDHSYTVRLVNNAGTISHAGIEDRAAFILPWGIAVDGAGRIYIADIGHHRVLRVEANAQLSVIAGTGTQGNTGDGGQGDQAQLSSPREVRFDGAGNLLIGSSTGPLRQVNLSTGIITTRLPNIIGYFDIDPSGDFITTRGQQVVRVNSSNGVETVVAGTGIAGFSGDGGPAIAATFNGLAGIDIDGAGNIYVADSGNNRVRRISNAGVVTAIAGGGAAPAQLNGVPDSQGIHHDRNGNLFFTDFQYHFIRRVLPGGTTKVVAGRGLAGTSGDGGPANNAMFGNPSMIQFDQGGRLFFLDLNGSVGTVRMIQPGADGLIDGASDEIISTVAGKIADRSLADRGAADGGPARNAVFDAARDFAMDSQGRLVITDWLDNRIRRVTPGADGVFNGGVDEIITTIAGNGLNAQTGDGGLATSAAVGAPLRLVLDASDNIYVYTGVNSPQTAIRRIDAQTGVITTVTQNVHALGITIDSGGRLFFANGSQVIRVNTSTGAQTLVAGTGAVGFSGDGGDALLAAFRAPTYLTVDNSNNIYVVDNGNFRIRRLVPRP
jgi:trimeric autotransporter adhesin